MPSVSDSPTDRKLDQLDSGNGGAIGEFEISSDDDGNLDYRASPVRTPKVKPPKQIKAKAKLGTRKSSRKIIKTNEYNEVSE